ncbi:hypothetical protein E4U43_006322 [Claviceps pusilla]|uniref:Uncharacterized protein n=1 Tax=Claviceps pusilla TaxID=123648 RepID=A0A9P7NFS8_9HYPO|nr:hypothetical protein E4U43_006322 [Claviceps pusilla]
MHFSTSAALAATALFAGQTLAACSAWKNYNAAQMKYCHNDGGPNVWRCDPDTILTRAGNKWGVFARKGHANISVICSDDIYSYGGLYCPANTAGTFELHCPTDRFIVSTVDPLA